MAKLRKEHRKVKFAQSLRMRRRKFFALTIFQKVVIDKD
jgi:hypothetical protein